MGIYYLFAVNLGNRNFQFQFKFNKSVQFRVHHDATYRDKLSPHY